MRHTHFLWTIFLSVVVTCQISGQKLEFQVITEIHPDQLHGVFITDVDVTSSGYIAIAINDIAKVQLYNFDGEFINEYGRRGRGPGDFTNLMSVDLTDTILYAMDSGPSGRIHAFNRADPGSYRTYVLPRSPHGNPLRMWHMGSEDFLVEFRPGFTNQNINEELTSTFGLVTLFGNGEIQTVIENRSNEMFVDQSDGGFSVSSMPFGRKNFIIPSGTTLYHNWSGEFKIQKIGLDGSEIGSFQPHTGSEHIEITEEDYRVYFLNELGITRDDDLEDVLRSMSADRSSVLRMRTVQAKLDNRDKLHNYYPAYKWVTGDQQTLCFGSYTEDIEVHTVTCTDENGEILGEGALTSDVTILSQSSEFLAGLRQLEDGLQSVIVYKVIME